MASIIPGFEYDIFISYRQKDNKHDGWVTEFVSNLEGELESTFKEEITVYFDINPHDGLLETHDVDASLKEKLKCLIFIPIISRTYCDPKSFAWEHEFKEFILQASSDQFGLKIKVQGGNVASRVLPIQIHELDPDDKKCIEEALCGQLRGIEFIYKEPGLDRPLRSEDKEEKNQCATKYNNQITKVAHAIREIISGLKNNTGESGAYKISIPSKSTRSQKHRLFYFIGSVIFFMISGGVLFSFFHKKNSETIEKSIAVLPFKLLSDEQDKQYLADGMMEAITLHLSRINDLKVMSRTSVEQYKETKKSPRQIGNELDVHYLLEGSFQKFDEDARLIVRLIKADEERQTWGNEYNNKWTDVFSLQSEVAQDIANELHALITPEVKQSIEKNPTTNLTAYDFYQRGQEDYSKFQNNPMDFKSLERAESYYKEALRYDSSYSMAYSGLALIYFSKHYAEEYYTPKFLDSCMILLDKSLHFDIHNAEAHYNKALCFWELGKIELVGREIDQALKYNPNYWEAYFMKGNQFVLYYKDLDYIKAFENFNKALSLNHDRNMPAILRDIGVRSVAFPGFFDLGKKYLLQALELDNDSSEFLYSMAKLYGAIGDFGNAVDCYNKSLRFDSINPALFYDLACVYSKMGRDHEALKYFVSYSGWLKKTRVLDGGGYHRIAYAYWIVGDKKNGELWFNEQKKYCEETIRNNRTAACITLSTYYDLAGVYAFLGEKEEAYRNLRIFSKISVCPLWWLTLIKTDPLFANMKNEKEFIDTIKDLEMKYNREHERFQKWLEENHKL